MLNGRESDKRDVAEVLDLGGSLWAVGFVRCVATDGVFRRRRRQQPILGANARAERSPATGIPGDFCPLVPLCLNRPDKAPLWTMRRSLHLCCVLGRTDRYSTARTVDAGGYFSDKRFFSHWRTNLHLSKISVKSYWFIFQKNGWCKHLILIFFLWILFSETTPQLGIFLIFLNKVK